MMAIKRRASRVFAKARDRPYSYISKNDNKTKNFRNNMRAKHMESGNKKLRHEGADLVFTVSTCDRSQIPERVYETTRITFLTELANKFGKIEKQFYLYRYIKIPHQILRLKTAASAGKGISVDRISTGMKNAFGKFYSFATRIVPKMSSKKVVPQEFLKVYFTKEYSDPASTKKIYDIICALKNKLPVKIKVTYTKIEPDSLKTN